ncbi:uncharacterized protein LOC144353285, partial [Saccoglossus kowalevskii]
MMDLTEVDPFSCCITIASVCNVIFRKNFLTPDTIGVVPEKGYLSAQNQSADAIRWMEYEAHVNNTRIQHVRNSRREMKIGPYHIDGYDASTETLYEYYGCYFHGCPKCFPRRNETNRKNELSMTSLYERLLAREEWLKSKGYSLVTMWECDFKNLMKNNHKVERFVGNLDISNPIRGREAFLGGRTNALRLYYEIKEGEKIEYVEDRTMYIQRYHEREGIVLDRSKITPNPGLRALAKLNLNSFWGKLGQRSNFGQSTYVETSAKLLEMLMDSTKNVTDLSFVSDEMVLVQHCDKEDYITEAPNTNVVLAAMMTSYDRLKFYSVLEKLGSRVLYFDTDSIIYIHRAGEWDPPT